MLFKRILISLCLLVGCASTPVFAGSKDKNLIERPAPPAKAMGIVMATTMSVIPVGLPRGARISTRELLAPTAPTKGIIATAVGTVISNRPAPPAPKTGLIGTVIGTVISNRSAPPAPKMPIAKVISTQFRDLKK